MGLDISKIENAALKRLAYTFDTDSEKNVLSEKEFELFKQEAAKRTDISDGDFNQAMGLYTTSPIAKTEATEATKNTTDTKKTSNKKLEKEANETHIKYLKGYVNDGISRQAALAELDKLPNLDPEFRKAVVDVINLMPASFNSSKEINHKELEKNLKDANMDDDLHKDILKQLEKMAKNECVNAKREEIEDLYVAMRIEDPTKSAQQIMDEIKNKAKDADNFKGDFKTAYKSFNLPKQEAFIKVLAAIDQVKDTENGGKVQDKAEEYLKANGQWDKYTKEALLGSRNVFERFGNFLTGYKGDGRTASNNHAIYTRVERKKIQTEDEILKSLGKKSDLFIAMKESGLIKETEDGKWDLSELSAIIGKQLGTDGTLNRDAKKDKDTAEVLMTKSKLAALSELSDQLSEDDAKALVKLCGYEIDGKHWGRAIFQGIVGAASGAALTAGSTYAAGQLPKDIVVSYKSDETYNISAALNAQIADKLPEGITIDASGSIHIATDLLINITKLAGQLNELALWSAVPGALVGGALGLVNGLKDKGQMPKIPVNFDEMNYEDYAATLKESKTEYANVALLIAASFVDGEGNWDREGYKNFLNEMAGDKNGIINREELIGGLQKRLKELGSKKEEPVAPDTTQPDEDNTLCTVEVEKVDGVETEKVEDKTFVHKRSENPNVGWKEMVEAYFPGLVEACGGKLYGPNGAIRAFQKELCTDENGNFDANKLKALISASDVPKEIKIPLQVKGIDRVETKPTPAGQTRPTDSGNGQYKPAMDKVGRDEIVRTRQVGPTTCIAEDGCDGVRAVGTTEQEAVANLKKQTGKTYENEADYQ